MKNRKQLGIFALCLCLILVWLFCLSMGRYPVSLTETFCILLQRVINIPKFWANSSEIAILQMRLPRITAAVLIGGGLAGAGSAYQGVFRNPMVSPDVLGASSGSAFGAALAIFCGFSSLLISVFSFGFGVLAVFFASFLGKTSRRSTTLVMVLTGMMVGSLFSSATSLLKLVADTEEILPAITYWLMGSLSGIDGPDLPWLASAILVGLLPIFVLRWRTNLLAMGEKDAQSLGVNTKILRLILLACATLLTAISVAYSGLIGWVGLVVPHFARLIFGSDYRYVTPASILLGGIFLALVDTISRSILPVEIPIGILTSFVGAPIFLVLILRGGKRHGN